MKRVLWFINDGPRNKYNLRKLDIISAFEQGLVFKYKFQAEIAADCGIDECDIPYEKSILKMTIEV